LCLTPLLRSMEDGAAPAPAPGAQDKSE
jgi:hypothetical protein